MYLKFARFVLFFLPDLIRTDSTVSTTTPSFGTFWPTSKTSSILASHKILTKTCFKYIKPLEGFCVLRLDPREVW